MLGLLMLLESSVIALFIVLLARNSPLRLVLLLGLGALLLGLIFGLLLAPLWTKHRLSDTHFHLRYGLDRLSIPRAALAAVWPVHQRLNLLEPIRAQNDTGKRRITAAFSERGQVLLLLKEPQTMCINGTSGLVEQILINVDRRDDFLAAAAAFGRFSSRSASSDSEH
jgi:hypothetical protein